MSNFWGAYHYDVLSEMSPERAILIHSPGRKPWVNNQSTYLEPQRGGTHPQSKCPGTRAVSAAPAELILFLSVCPQGFISGFALISPWTMIYFV